MAQIAVWTILVYALIVAAGGVVGYIKAKSQKSLIAGLLSSTALLVAWFFAMKTPTLGLAIASAMAAVLLLIFITRFVSTRKFMPAGMMMFLNLAATIFFLLGWLKFA